MRIAAPKKPKDCKNSTGIDVHVPRVRSSPRVSESLSCEYALEMAAEVEEWSLMDTNARPSGSFLSEAPVHDEGIPAKLLQHDAISTATADNLISPFCALSPNQSARDSPKRNKPPRQSSPQLRDVGGTVYHRPILQPLSHTARSDLLVYRAQSFLPYASRPATRQTQKPQVAAPQTAEAYCNGPMLDRFPLRIQGGLSAQQVQRAHTPAYEPRIWGGERDALAQTFLVPTPKARGNA
jgi:hypothetical protein